jgi:hypothetical protein
MAGNPSRRGSWCRLVCHPALLFLERVGSCEWCERCAGATTHLHVWFQACCWSMDVLLLLSMQTRGVGFGLHVCCDDGVLVAAAWAVVMYIPWHRLRNTYVCCVEECGR